MTNVTQPVLANAGTAMTPTKPVTPGALAAIYRLVLRHQITRGRLALFAASFGLCILVGAATGASADDPVSSAANVVSALGFGLLLPVIPLVLGSAALGDWVEDETLVYVWLRPVSRLVIALGATMAVATVAVPTVVIASTILAALGSNGDSDVILGAVAGSATAGLAYTSLFVLVGLLLRRALLWGLVYVFVWEFAVARFGAGAARFSINSYATSILSRSSGVELPLDDRAVWSSYAVPLAVAAAAIALTTWWLNRAKVA